MSLVHASHNQMAAMLEGGRNSSGGFPQLQPLLHHIQEYTYSQWQCMLPQLPCGF